MPLSAASSTYTCTRSLRANSSRIVSRARVPSRLGAPASVRPYTEQATAPKDDASEGLQEANGRDQKVDRTGSGAAVKQEEGAMTRRLRDMSDEALETGGRSARKAMSEAGFSDDLKKQLEERIAAAEFRVQNHNAFVEAELPATASRHVRDIATATPWSGTESIHDASLRMLNDAHKPMKVTRGSSIPGPAARLPTTVDTGRPGHTRGAGIRLANARDRSGLYTSVKESDIDDQERQKRFQELKDRFSPHARAVVPGTVQGLAALANERIEDAIARGQFKNLANRGKEVERDYNASNPFIDTTEYFLNSIIQKQEIVPPWIEKQQELVAAASKFRSRLRADWKRHAARIIASKGGTLQEQIRKAEAYAQAELIANPKAKKREQEAAGMIQDEEHASQISLSGELQTPSSKKDGPSPMSSDDTCQSLSSSGDSPLPSQTTPLRAAHPFRDPDWEAIEFAYHTAAIKDLNSKTRTYNLQAPDLAKKPYFSLQRELNACFADMAPQLAEAIRQRATKPIRKMEGFGQSLAGGSSGSGVMGQLVGEKVKIRDERTGKQYGFRQFWHDVWGSSK